jgi:hypothetical protein
MLEVGNQADHGLRLWIIRKLCWSEDWKSRLAFSRLI